MFKVNIEKCIGCGKCVRDCFPEAIKMIEGKADINNDYCISCGHCIAVCPVKAVETDHYDMTEIIEYTKAYCDLDAENLLNFIKHRRTIRHYQDRPVEKEKIQKIIEAGRFTPTSSNSQDVVFTVVHESLSEFKELIYEGLKVLTEQILDKNANQPKQLRAYALRWKKMYREFHKNNENDKLFFNAKTVLIVSSKNIFNGSIASANMELMINALGLGTLYSGFILKSAEVNPKVKEFLKVEGEITSCMLLGYPDVEYMRTVPRKKAEINWM